MQASPKHNHKKLNFIKILKRILYFLRKSLQTSLEPERQESYYKTVRVSGGRTECSDCTLTLFSFSQTLSKLPREVLSVSNPNVEAKINYSSIFIRNG